MSLEPFVSFAPNREDVVLRRALHEVSVGSFLEIGTRGPQQSSIGHAFTRLDWVGASWPNSSPGHEATDISELHFVVIDAVPTDRISVVEALLAKSPRPWILVLRDSASAKITRPEPADLEALTSLGYDLCLNDGVSLFLVDRVRSEQLRAPLSFPANALDDVVYHEDRLRDQMITDLAEQNKNLSTRMSEHDAANMAAVLDWRRFAVDAWARAATAERTTELHALRKQIELNINHIKVVDGEIDRLRKELEAVQNTFSWRITRPLRRVKSFARRGRS